LSTEYFARVLTISSRERDKKNKDRPSFCNTYLYVRCAALSTIFIAPVATNASNHPSSSTKSSATSLFTSSFFSLSREYSRYPEFWLHKNQSAYTCLQRRPRLQIARRRCHRIVAFLRVGMSIHRPFLPRTRRGEVREEEEEPKRCR
jgi:hypothetical protein